MINLLYSEEQYNNDMKSQFFFNVVRTALNTRAHHFTVGTPDGQIIIEKPRS